MTYIVQGFDSSNQAHMAVIPKIMGEVLLCLKDSNAKTRETAYQLLLEMSVARGDMTDYFKIILAALGAKTSHMRSAAVMALSRLTFEYARNDSTVQSLLPSLMQTVAFLFDDSSREVTKSVIGFVRVCVAAMSIDQLDQLLPVIVSGILKYNKGRDRFRAKIKIILKKLVRLYGYDVIAPLVPEKDTRLITHMRKLTERTERRRAAGLQDGRSDAHFDKMMESDEDDSDDGRTFMTGATGFTKLTSMTGKSTKHSSNDRSMKNKSVVSVARSTKTSKSTKSTSGPRIKAELKGEILDMLDASKMAKSVHFADMNMRDNDFSDDDDDGMDEMQFDNQGRIIISEGLQKVIGCKGATDDMNSDNDDDENLQFKAGGDKRRRVSKFESVKVAKAERDAANARQQTNKPKPSIGSAYKSKKAGGDVKKKGQKYEPYAYVPLNARDYSKKNRSNAVSKMGTVVRSNKRKR
jgi:ribosomal RNA-processing protein 12